MVNATRQGIIKRLLIALSLLWVVGSSIHTYFDIDSRAYDSADFWQKQCEQDVVSGKSVNCAPVFDQRYWESWGNEFWAILMVAFGPFFIILVLASISYFLLRIFFWIKTGERKAQKKLFISKYNVGMVIGALLLFCMLIAKTEWKEGVKERNLAICKLDLVKLDEPDYSYKGRKYLETCMNTRGFKLHAKSSSCYDAQNFAFCYE